MPETRVQVMPNGYRFIREIFVDESKDCVFNSVTLVFDNVIHISKEVLQQELQKEKDAYNTKARTQGVRMLYEICDSYDSFCITAGMIHLNNNDNVENIKKELDRLIDDMCNIVIGDEVNIIRCGSFKYLSSVHINTNTLDEANHLDKYVFDKFMNNGGSDMNDLKDKAIYQLLALYPSVKWKPYKVRVWNELKFLKKYASTIDELMILDATDTVKNVQFNSHDIEKLMKVSPLGNLTIIGFSMVKRNIAYTPTHTCNELHEDIIYDYYLLSRQVCVTISDISKEANDMLTRVNYMRKIMKWK